MSVDLLRERREKWIKNLEGDDPNCIWQQVSHMLWDAAAFRAINEAIRIAPQDSTGNIKLNGMLYGLLQRCFFREQAVTIRRVTDASSEIDNLKRGTSSLGVLLKDIKFHRALLTRGAIFEVEGLEYDIEKLERKEREYIDKERELTQNTSGAVWIPNDVCPTISQHRHAALDVLCGVNAGSRTPDDVISEKVLDHLTDRLFKVCDPIRLHTDKFIAHAATAENRATVKDLKDGMSLKMYKDAYKVILQTCSIIGADILGKTSHGGLPIASGDKFRYLDQPLATTDDIKKLDAVWEEFYREAHEWDSWLASDLRREAGF